MPEYTARFCKPAIPMTGVLQTLNFEAVDGGEIGSTAFEGEA
jgi:hypothetical protein